MSTKVNEIEFTKKSIRLSGKFNFIIFPISIITLRKILSEQDYETPKNPEIPAGAGIVEIEGQIGKKEGLTVDCQIDRQIIGVNSDDTEKLLSAFDKLDKSISTELGQELSENSQFYETIIQFTIKTGKNPMEILAKLRGKYPLSETISDIIGENASPFTLRYSATGKPIQTTDWFEYRIEPLVQRATTTYYSSFVFRNKDKNKVLEIVKKSQDMAVQIVKEIESI